MISTRQTVRSKNSIDIKSLSVVILRQKRSVAFLHFPIQPNIVSVLPFVSCIFIFSFNHIRFLDTFSTCTSLNEQVRYIILILKQPETAATEQQGSITTMWANNRLLLFVLLLISPLLLFPNDSFYTHSNQQCVSVIHRLEIIARVAVIVEYKTR